jgi:hypothetical protein
LELLDKRVPASKHLLFHPTADLTSLSFTIPFSKALAKIYIAIQDVALLQPEFPSHDVFADPLFQTPEYRKFKKDVTVAADARNREDRLLVELRSACLWSANIYAPWLALYRRA